MTSYVTDPAIQCKGKKAFGSKADAKRWLKRSSMNTSGMNVYRCPHCQSFHMGHKPRSDRRW